jgi:DNA-binding transcriptional ArsR family regulator
MTVINSLADLDPQGAAIAKALARTGFVTVAWLAEHTNVPESVVRATLRQLYDTGMLLVDPQKRVALNVYAKERLGLARSRKRN